VGFYGIDIAAGPEVDLALDIERTPMPFPNGSVSDVYSGHAFEHLESPGSPIQTLREIMRICEHGGTAEIWTPYGKSNDALLFGHRVFYAGAIGSTFASNMTTSTWVRIRRDGSTGPEHNMY
jgi:predicted SAM-dependent methyltransferase